MQRAGNIFCLNNLSSKRTLETAAVFHNESLSTHMQFMLYRFDLLIFFNGQEEATHGIQELLCRVLWKHDSAPDIFIWQSLTPHPMCVLCCLCSHSLHSFHVNFLISCITEHPLPPPLTQPVPSLPSFSVSLFFSAVNGNWTNGVLEDSCRKDGYPDSTRHASKINFHSSFFSLILYFFFALTWQYAMHVVRTHQQWCVLIIGEGTMAS